MGIAHSDLLGILRYPGLSPYVNRTFKIMPDPFKQVLIVMAYDPSVDVDVAIMYVLATSKNDWMYWHMFHWLKVSCDLRLFPRTIACDFNLPFHSHQRSGPGCQGRWLPLSLQASLTQEDGQPPYIG